MHFEFSRLMRHFSAVLSGFILGGLSFAQVQSGGLPDPDLWTVSFLNTTETALPETSWAASDSADLLSLTRTTRTRNLSPLEQTLMRRLVLSPATAPKDDGRDELLAERARLMFQIGEASAAAQLLPTLNTPPVGFDADEVAVDLQLAIGQTDAACLNGVGDKQTGAFWTRLRAVCFALEGNSQEAELAMELAGAQGINDVWLSKAIFATSGALPNKPEARFDSGLSLAISAKAGLEPSISTIANSRLDLAAAIARQDTFSPSMRVQAAGVAAEAGLLNGEDHRELYKALVQSEGFDPRTPLEVALQMTLTEGSNPSAQARALRAALQTARGNAARYSAVARLLMPDIRTLPFVPGNARMALDFAGAALATGDLKATRDWIALGVEEDPFLAAWMLGLSALSDSEGVENASMAMIAEALLVNGKSLKQKQANMRLFMLWQAAGLQVPPQARAFLAEPAGLTDDYKQKPASEALKASILAAADAGAGAETLLRLLAIVKGDAYRLPVQDVTALIKALRSLGQRDAARALALEASGYWHQTL